MKIPVSPRLYAALHSGKRPPCPCLRYLKRKLQAVVAPRKS